MTSLKSLYLPPPEVEDIDIIKDMMVLYTKNPILYDTKLVCDYVERIFMHFLSTSNLLDCKTLLLVVFKYGKTLILYHLESSLGHHFKSLIRECASDMCCLTCSSIYYSKERCNYLINLFDRERNLFLSEEKYYSCIEEMMVMDEKNHRDRCQFFIVIQDFVPDDVHLSQEFMWNKVKICIGMQMYGVMNIIHTRMAYDDVTVVNECIHLIDNLIPKMSGSNVDRYKNLIHAIPKKNAF